MRAALSIFLVLLWGGTAAAAEWGTIVPGESTNAGVKTEFGEPSSVTKKTVDGYETTEWTYEGARAPLGMKRMVVEFGLLMPKGFVPYLVRTFRLEPKPGVFPRGQVVLGWGKPDRAQVQDGAPLRWMYNSGLVVYFDKETSDAVSMWFTRPLPIPGSEGAAPAPAATTTAPAGNAPGAKPKAPDAKPRR